MSGGSRIVAFGPGGEQPSVAGETGTADASAPGGALESPSEITRSNDDAWAIEVTTESAASSRVRDSLAPSVAASAIVGWTAFFVWAQWPSINNGITPSYVTALVWAWSTPAIMICMVWLLLMRTSRRESARFGNVARMLGEESSRLEQRLVAVNRELSLAREFIAAQSRDLESLGRVAVERLSQHAGHLQGLITNNSAQVAAVATVSTTALENMERLRGQLPVIASSAKDVANNIAHAGRSAQIQLDDLTTGFARLTEASGSSEREVSALQDRVDSALALFETRLEHLQQLVAIRLEELTHRGAELRGRLDDGENQALESLRRRSAALSEEFDNTRHQLDGHEAEALTSLRARLSALRDEGSALARALRDGEAGALQALNASKSRVEAEIVGVVERLDRLDRDALDAARARIAALSDEAEAFDNRLAERNVNFTAETEHRLAAAAARHDAEVARLSGLFARLDEDLAARQRDQDERQRSLGSASEALVDKLGALSERIAAIAAFGNQAEESLGRGLGLLADKLTSSREALAGTDVSVAQLTDGAVRLLELLQASTEQSRDQLPTALAAGELRLGEWEQRIAGLHQAIEAASGRGDALANSVADTRTTLDQSLTEMDRLHCALGDRAQDHAASLENLRQTLALLERESLSVAQQAQDELATAIERLGAATRDAAATLADDTQDAVASLANRLGEETGMAIDRAMRIRLAESVGQLEQAAAHAAGVSREAAIQLRDQLAKVDQLTGNLERRVAQARTRAEEQVDNDFARRVALITESLNSNAIDIAKALSTDVTDTTWAAYLRGDRGVFTRRAVRLIDAAEAREIARIYENDSEFRDHVSRYIHDFEAMLRQLLSTRDGHALGVTLLSSDMGKLYVVLAQAIERLRA